MNKRLTQYIQSKGIDSFQKLQFLLFLHQHPQMKGTHKEFAEQLYWGDITLLTKIIIDLQFAGLIEQVGQRYKLRNEPGNRFYLQKLARTFENPLARQELIDHVQAQKSLVM